MRPVLVIVGDVFANQPVQVGLIQCDHVVQQLSPAGSDPPIGHAVLPRRLNTRALRFQADASQEVQDLCTEFRVVIEDGKTIFANVGECFAELVDNPFCRRMAQDIEMQDPASSMLDDDQDVQEAEPDCRNREKVERDNGFSMILEECQPKPAGITPAMHSAQVAGDRSFRDAKTQLEEFGVDPECSPSGVLGGQTPDEIADFFGHRPATGSPSGAPSPVATESCAMPSYDRVRFDDEQTHFPPKPITPEDNPEEPVERVQGRTGTLSLKNGDLLAQSRV